METTPTTITTTVKRPVFLTVLCVLSFVGIAYNFINGISGYFIYSASDDAGNIFLQMLGSTGQQMEDNVNNMMNSLGLDPAKMAINSLIVALMNIPILAGVLLMWKQKKSGFYVYAVSETVQAVIPFIFLNGLAGGFTGIIYVIIAIVFIVLYGLNLKSLY